MGITGASTANEDEVLTKSQRGEAEPAGERAWWGGKRRQPARSLATAEAIRAGEQRLNFALCRGLVRWQWPRLLGRGICPVPLSLLGLAAGVMVQTEQGLRASGDNSALSVTAREQTQLCSFRPFGLCSPCLKPKAAELTAQQLQQDALCDRPGKGCAPQLTAAQKLLQCLLRFALFQDPQTQPVSRVFLSVLGGGDCQWGASLPLVLLAGDLLSRLAPCRHSP